MSAGFSVPDLLAAPGAITCASLATILYAVCRRERTPNHRSCNVPPAVRVDPFMLVFNRSIPSVGTIRQSLLSAKKLVAL